MSVTDPAPAPGTPPSPSAAPRRFSILNVLLVVVPVALIVGAAGGWYYRKTMQDADVKFDFFQRTRANLQATVQLDKQFSDADNDLVADAPKDAAKLVDPKELVFATLGRDEEDEKKIWKDFAVHLKSKTDKEIKIVLNTTLNNEQLHELAGKDVHLFMFSTGTVPSAVNVAGFVPMCVMADTEGKFGYQVELLTPANSPVKSLQDIRGRTMAFMSFQSNSGFKFPVMLLRNEMGMHPDRDYQWRYAGAPENGLRWVHESKADVIPVASDYLKRELARPEKDRLLNPSDYRTIYTSKTFPPACFGHAYNLKPELAGKIKEAFLSFNWKGTSLEEAYKSANQSKFVSVNYKEHWAIVRDVDEQLMKFVEQKQ